MKHKTTKFTNLRSCLKELGPFIQNGEHLQTGRPFKQFGGLRSREILANWLLCVVINSEVGFERITFHSDPTGGDGIIRDSETNETWQTEHILVPKQSSKQQSIEELILESINKKRNRGRSYASGKTLIVFLNIASIKKWKPNDVVSQLPHPLYFEKVWIVGLQEITDNNYTYNVVRLDKPTCVAWQVCIGNNFEKWEVRHF